MKPSPNCFLCWWIVPWASPTPRYVTRNWNCLRLDRTVHWFHSFVIFSDFAEEFKFFTDQVRPALGSVGCFGWFWPCSGSHIYRHICLNHQETYQTNPMAPLDSLDIPIDPLGPLSLGHGELKTKNVAWELQISAQFTPGLANICFSNKVPVRVKEKKV